MGPDGFMRRAELVSYPCSRLKLVKSLTVLCFTDGLNTTYLQFLQQWQSCTRKLCQLRGISLCFLDDHVSQGCAKGSCVGQFEALGIEMDVHRSEVVALMDHFRDQITNNEDKTLRSNVVSSGHGRDVVCAVSFSGSEKLLI